MRDAWSFPRFPRLWFDATLAVLTTPQFMFLLRRSVRSFAACLVELAFTKVWQNDWQLFELLACPSENIETPWCKSLLLACIVHLPCVTLYPLHFGWLMQWPRATTPWQAPSPDSLLIWLRQKRLIAFAKGLLSIKLEPKKGRSTQQTETYSPNSYIDT